MAWRDLLLDCSFRGVVFDVVGTRDSMGRAVSVAEYPYQDGGVVSDLGGRPGRFSLQAIFFGDDYEARLTKALAAFNEAGTGELIHPVWGSIEKAQFLGGEITHAAPEPDACTVSLEFIESATGVAFFEALGSIQVQEIVGAPGDQALDAAISAVAEIIDTLRALNPLAAFDGLRQSMLGPLLSFSSQTAGVVTSGLDLLDSPRAWARDIASLSNGLLDSVSFPGKLMQDWRAITGVFQNIGTQWGYGSTAGSSSPGYSWPTASPWSAGSAPTQAQAQSVVRAYLAVSNATAQTDVTAMLLAAEATTPTLSPFEIETVANAARNEIEVAISTVRGVMSLEQSRAITEPLKNQALALQNAARAIIEARPPLVQRTLSSSGNLRLIAHRLYGDHSRATELLRLNNLRLPNALQAGDVLNAYAR